MAENGNNGVDESTSPPSGDPSVIGLPAFLVGSMALGLTLIHYVPVASQGASVAIIAFATGIGLLVATIWAASMGQSIQSCIFGIFSGFWMSYATLLLGLDHSWYAIPKADVAHSVALFLISWLVIIVVLTLATLSLPSTFTLLFILVDVALALVLAGTLRASSSLDVAGGVVVFAFVVDGIYLFLSALSVATGGGAYSLGRPVLQRGR